VAPSQALFADASSGTSSFAVTAAESKFRRALADLARSHDEVVASMSRAQEVDAALARQQQDALRRASMPASFDVPQLPIPVRSNLAVSSPWNSADLKAINGSEQLGVPQKEDSTAHQADKAEPQPERMKRVTTNGKEDVVYLPGAVGQVSSDCSELSATSYRSTRSMNDKGFALRTVWRDINLHSFPFHIATKLSLQSIADDDIPMLVDETSFGHRCISFPSSTKRMVWDLVGALLIVYDLISIPMNVFDMPTSTFSVTMDWLTLLFWTINIPASCTVGFVQEGITIMIPRQIIANYLKTWCIVDLAVVVPDWTFSTMALVSGGENEGESVRLLRIMRLARILRLLRLLKLRKLLTHVNDLIDSEYMSIVINIVKMILSLLAINHFIACIWFLVADSRANSGDMTWVQASGFEEASWDYQYATSFHWAITQFTPASMDVQPQNLLERVFAVTIVVFALVGFSYLVGSITGSLTQLRSMQEDASKQFWTLRRFLAQKELTKNHKELSLRIQRYVEHEYEQQRDHVQQKNVKILALLSKQLLSQLNWTLKKDTVKVHPLFTHLKNESEVTMHRLANSTMDRVHFAQNDTLFLTGEVAEEMSIVLEGKLQYIKVSQDGEDKKEFVDRAEDWIAEPVLWSPTWEHLGVLMVVVQSELLTINGDKFCEVTKMNPQAWACCAHYAKKFIRWLNDQKEEMRSDIFQGEIVKNEIAGFIPEGARRSLDISIHSDRLMGKTISKRSTKGDLSPRSSPRIGSKSPPGKTSDRGTFQSENSGGSFMFKTKSKQKLTEPPTSPDLEVPVKRPSKNMLSMP